MIIMIVIVVFMNIFMMMIIIIGKRKKIEKNVMQGISYLVIEGMILLYKDSEYFMSI